ncbi:neuronal acetylcholine receptor subunit non-alpha-3-like [Schistocerca cancellata]|uniref:neuronal acetylcholine receptor subunit non-alpha-3-like n=1 Tax=Schistocerca cancellata TaxID=274614 RepID=UPI00211906DA|nr:neuronal acetylcholine receptor subunit non-alpha-3-like [Schistocerca cancellata]
MDTALPLFVLPLLLVTFSGERRAVEAVSASASQRAAVRSALFKNYDRALPPPGDQLKVRLFISLFNVDLYGYARVMEIQGLIYIAWTDSRLSWTGSDVVKNVYVYTDEIWTPDLGVLHKWQDDPDESSLVNTGCFLSSTGYVECMPPAYFRSHCKPDNSRWPYSRNNCTLRLASKLPIQKLKFELMEVVFVYELASRNWDNFQLSSYTEEVGGRSNVVLSFELKRHNLIQIAAFVAPAFVLVLLTVSTWFLPISCDERLLLATLSVFLHCAVIDSLSYAMPEDGRSAPQVVLMYRDLLVVACASFMAAVGLRRLGSLRTLDTPVWLPSLLESGPARFLLCSPHGSLRLQEEDDAEGLVSEEEPVAAATPAPAAILALLINRLGLVASTATCVAALSVRLMA